MLYMVRERGDGTPDFAHFRQKYPDTQAKRKIPRSSEKNPDVVTNTENQSPTGNIIS